MGEDVFLTIAGLLIGLLVAFAVLVVFMMSGFYIGLWSVPCPMESSQPRCVAQGWNGQTIHLHGVEYKVVKP